MTTTYWRCDRCKQVLREEHFPGGGLICKTCRDGRHIKRRPASQKKGGRRAQE